MSQLLFINACTSIHNPSRTMSLCAAFLAAYKADPAWQVQELVLEQSGLQPLTAEDLRQRDLCCANGNLDGPAYAAARAFAAADLVVIGAPYWDLSFPSQLKIFIEHIMVPGLTFGYTPAGPQGLCRARALVYAVTAGGYIKEPDWGFGYLKAIGEMLGITAAHRLAAQGLDIDGAPEGRIMAEAAEAAVALEKQLRSR